MDTAQILNFIREKKDFLNQQFGVRRIGIFGSFSRNQQRADSDIDVFIEAEPDFRKLAALWDFLELNLGRKVDLIRKHPRLRPTFLARIEKDMIYA